jgi:transcriptional regulator with XRE-family HTH domain/DNA-binding transcriptional ArsR family regulator
VKDLTREFLRAVRGNRSQVAFSRRVGFSSNVAAEWESGRRVPAAATALAICARSGIDVAKSFDVFHRDTAPLILLRGKGKRLQVDAKSVASWLRAHRARTRATELAVRSGISTFKLSRIFSGKSGVSLRDFFTLVDAMTDRLTDLIAALIEIERAPSAAQVHAKLEASRELAFSDPWTSAVLALLETDGYLASEQGTAQFLARRLRLSESAIEAALTALTRAGLVARRDGKYRVKGALTIDTRGRTGASLALRRHWANVGAERLLSPGARDLFAYNVFSASHADFARIRELLQQCFREVRAIIARSEPSEAAGLFTVQLFEWDEEAQK